MANDQTLLEKVVGAISKVPIMCGTYRLADDEDGINIAQAAIDAIRGEMYAYAKSVGNYKTDYWLDTSPLGKDSIDE